MERFELEPSLKEEIRARVLGEGFMKLVQSVRRNGKTFRIALRPVEIGGERKFQAEMNDDGQVQVKNLSVSAAAEGLEEIINQRGARELHLMTASGDLHLRVTKKGHALVSRSAELERVATVQPHDRVKKLPLTSFDSTALLRVIGIADGSGQIKASMRGKYDQVNEFLKMVKETVGEKKVEKVGGGGEASHAASHEPPFTVVDCGCGKAYLTISLYFYLTQVLKFPDVKVIGIDRRADVIAAARKMVEQLDVADKVLFVEADLGSVGSIESLGSVGSLGSIGSVGSLGGVGLVGALGSAGADSGSRPENRTGGQADRVDMVVSLHACDTATDEALARGVEWKAKYILSAPCCQHELQKELARVEAGGGRATFSGLLRQSILRERMCDILTDSFRAMILRILGFKTQVIEFVSSEATARNILLKCEYGVKPGQPGPIGEYLELRDYWKVTPWLETRLAKSLARHLERFV